MTSRHFHWMPFVAIAALLSNLSACGPYNDGDSGAADSPPGPTVPPGVSPPSAPTEASFGVGGSSAHPGLSNQPGSNFQTTPFEIHSGDTLEIQPTGLVMEQRSLQSPKVTRLDKQVCVKSQQVCIASEPITQHQCDDQCHVCVQCVPLTPVCSPWRCCDTVCHDVTTGSRCTQTSTQCTEEQDQWQEITAYIAPGPSIMEPTASPMTEANLMLAGLKLQFLSSAGTPTTCPLSAFQPTADARHFVLNLHNVGGCEIFAGAGPAGAVVHIGVVNQMGESISYLVGTQIKTWDGRVLQAASQQSYLPYVGFAGTLTWHASPSTATASKSSRAGDL